MSDFGRETIGGGGGAAVEERVLQEQNIEPGDHERYSHYVRKEKIVESAVMGTPVVALCGKVWVPGRDPQKFPVCPACLDIYNGSRPENPDGSGDGGSGGAGDGAGGSGN